MKELREFTSFVIDYRGKTPLKLGLKWSNSGYRALSAKNIKTGHIVNEGSIYYGDETLYKTWMKDEIQRGDILITSEAPFGEVFYWDSDEKIILSQRLFCLRPQNILPQFLYYAMTSRPFQSELLSRATGTTVTGLRQPELLKCKVPVKSSEEQQHIVDILGSIDEKIENNDKIIHSLERDGELIFKDFIENKSLLKEHICLSDIATFYNGYSYSGDELCEQSDEALVTIKNFDRNGGFKVEGFKPIKTTGKIKTTMFVELGDLLVAHTDLTQNADIIGNPIIILNLGKYKKAIISMDLVKVESSKLSKELLYYILKNSDFKAYALGYCSGTTVLHLNKKALQEYEFDLPLNEALIEEVSNNLKTIFDRIQNAFLESQKLNELKQLYLKKFFG